MMTAYLATVADVFEITLVNPFEQLSSTRGVPPTFPDAHTQEECICPPAAATTFSSARQEARRIRGADTPPAPTTAGNPRRPPSEGPKAYSRPASDTARECSRPQATRIILTPRLSNWGLEEGQVGDGGW